MLVLEFIPPAASSRLPTAAGVSRLENPISTAHSSYARRVPATSPLFADVLATARNNVLLPQPERPTSGREAR